MYSFHCVLRPLTSLLFFFTDTATTEIYTLSLHDALPICTGRARSAPRWTRRSGWPPPRTGADRKSTRLNSSHEWISYAVFCLKKKKTKEIDIIHTSENTILRLRQCITEQHKTSARERKIQ